MPESLLVLRVRSGQGRFRHLFWMGMGPPDREKVRSSCRPGFHFGHSLFTHALVPQLEKETVDRRKKLW